MSSTAVGFEDPCERAALGEHAVLTPEAAQHSRQAGRRPRHYASAYALHKAAHCFGLTVAAQPRL